MDFAKAILLSKLAEILDAPPSTEITAHFPFLQQQQNWKYKHKDGILALKNGEVVHTFTFPEKLYPEVEEENHAFPIERLATDNYRDINSPEHIAQVHHAHPGELYITLHEGYRNPTYTIKHQEGNKWKALLKKKLSKKIKDLKDEQIEITKQSNIYDLGHNAIQTIKDYSNLPLPIIAGGALGESYLLNKFQKPSSFNNVHPTISKLMDYGIPMATALAMYYGGKNMFTPSATATFNAVG